MILLNDNSKSPNDNLEFLYNFALDTYSKERNRTNSLDTKLSVCLSLAIALLTASFSLIPIKAIYSKLPFLSNGCMAMFIIGIILFIAYLILIGLTCYKLFSAFITKRFYSVNTETFTKEAVYTQAYEDTLKFYVNDLGKTININREINDDKAKAFDTAVLLMMFSAVSFAISILLIKISIYM